MISTGDAKMRRTTWLNAQILRAFGRANAVLLLQVLFNDNPLISAGKYRDSAGPLRVGIG